MKTNIGLVDDHQLFIKSLGLMLATFNSYDVVVEASNGKELQDKFVTLKVLPDIMLIDVTMPVMDGIQTAEWLHKEYPAIKLVALSMNDNDDSIIAMLKAGCCAYLLKDTHPSELEKALHEIDTKGYYNGDASNINFRRLLLTESRNEQNQITEREKEFLQYACSDLTYKQIAAIMNVSERTVDGYRESLFEKLNVQSRVGMALEAIRKGFVNL
ncbi:MAG: response regulator transcription factor [Bacteroidota bacterium]|nr:response regulator transcription factor [Bacteroidota bacterium]